MASADPVHDAYEFDPTPYPVREVETVEIVNDGRSRVLNRDDARITFHDLRARKVNQQFAAEIEHRRGSAPVSGRR